MREILLRFLRWLIRQDRIELLIDPTRERVAPATGGNLPLYDSLNRKEPKP